MWIFLIKKIKLKKNKKINNDTWHNMSMTRVHFKKNHKITK